VASAIASSSDPTGTIGATGPNVSSVSSSDSSGAPVTTAGAKKWPRSWPARSPPTTTEAPAATAPSSWASTLALCAAETIGPTSVEGSSGSPTRSSRAWATKASRKSS
jgi:hypothetical protein